MGAVEELFVLSQPLFMGLVNSLQASQQNDDTTHQNSR